jgi:hypothetical protein
MQWSQRSSAAHNISQDLRRKRIRGGRIGRGHPAVLGCDIDERTGHATGAGRHRSAHGYGYFYPLVTMDLTRRQMTNVPAGKAFRSGPPNTFNNVPAYPSASDKVVVRPNFDTLYSSASLDLVKVPVVVSAPDANGRYHLLPMKTCGRMFSPHLAGAPRGHTRSIS